MLAPLSLKLGTGDVAVGTVPLCNVMLMRRSWFVGERNAASDGEASRAKWTSLPRRTGAMRFAKAHRSIDSSKDELHAWKCAQGVVTGAPNGRHWVSRRRSFRLMTWESNHPKGAVRQTDRYDGRR